MKSHTLIKRLSTGALLLGVLLPQAPLPAATTDPVGYTTITPTPSPDGTARRFTVASFPLSDAPVFAGALTQKPGTNPGDNILTIADANWTPDSFGPSASPSFVTHVVVPYSGASTGRVYPVTDNNASTITIDLPDGVPSAGASMESGDQIRVIPVNTLKKIFGGTTEALDALGWAYSDSQSSSDIVYVWNGSAWIAHWFNPSEGFWVNIFEQFDDQGGTPVYSDEAVWISRRSQGEMKLVIDGSVPVSPSAKLQLLGPPVPGGRYFTFVGNPYPKSITLSSLNLEELPDWLGSDSQANSDLVYHWNGTAWIAYWYDSTQEFWVNIFEQFEDQGSLQIPSGGGIWVARKSSPIGEDSFATVIRPFTP